MDKAIYEVARRWIDDDPDAQTRADGEAILASGDEALIGRRDQSLKLSLFLVWRPSSGHN